MVIFDVKPPSKDKLPKDKPFILEKRKSFREKAVEFYADKKIRYFLITAILVSAALSLNLLVFKNTLKNSLGVISKEAQEIKKAVPAFNISEITKSLETTDKKIKEVETGAEISGLAQASFLLGKIIPSLGELPGMLKSVSELSERILFLSRDVEQLKTSGFEMAANGKGDDLIGIFERTYIHLEEIERLNTDIKKSSPALENLSPKLASLYNIFNENYIYINLNLSRAKRAVEAVIAMLAPSQNRHILLIFQNPSEMRPAGGFIGSYGDITLNRGNLKDVRIDDIYNADRQIDLKLIPPRELQSITTNWGARDANWFFNFPTSAEKIITLMEKADLHSENQIEFEGVVAINTDVLGSMLDIIGPVEITEYEMMLDKNNFLEELQYEVEAGRDKKPGQNPKRVLSVFAPIILEKLGNLNEAEKNLLVSRLKEHFEKKDIMTYFKDWRIQNFMEELVVAGDVFETPKDFNGDYLAVINTNIAGGKTDAFITQTILLESEIKDDKALNRLKITRAHKGENEKDWWYNMTNKNYVKILISKKAEIVDLDGNNFKEIEEREYSKEYQRDIDLTSIEESIRFNKGLLAWTGEEFGKVSLGAWFNTPAGKTNTLAVKWETPIKVEGGARYSFIFEKQSGAQGGFEYSVKAPEGYIWQEAGGNVFEYKTENPKAREIIELELTTKSP